MIGSIGQNTIAGNFSGARNKTLFEAALDGKGSYDMGDRASFKLATTAIGAVVGTALGAGAGAGLAALAPKFSDYAATELTMAMSSAGAVIGGIGLTALVWAAASYNDLDPGLGSVLCAFPGGIVGAVFGGAAGALAPSFGGGIAGAAAGGAIIGAILGAFAGLSARYD
ncbi:MAG: hypothetical protein HYU64_15190 [Armatimonadetes bacterium]|nr:hypothetical protein [Armatimonadota bacterium]